MDRQAEIEIMSAVLIMLQDANDFRTETGVESEHIFVKTRTLGFLADRFRKSGIDPHAPLLGTLTNCSVCDRALDPEKGELFVGKGGEAYCNDHYPDWPVDEDAELVQDRVETEADHELERKLRIRPGGSS
jgi:hypothetical protein